MTSWEAARANAKRTAAAAALEGLYGKRQKQRRWHMEEPDGFEASWRQHLGVGARPADAHPVSWLTYKGIQEWDQRTHAVKMFHRLTPAHFNRTGFSRMNLGIAIDLFRRDHARGLRLLRVVHE